MTCSDGSASAFVTCSDNQLAIRSLSRLIANRAYRVRIGDLGVDCSSAGPEPSFVNHVCRYGASLDGWLSSANSSRAAIPLGFSLPLRPAHHVIGLAKARLTPLYGDPVGQLLKVLCKVGQPMTKTTERLVLRHHSEMRGPFSVVCLSRTRRVAEEFKSPQSLVGHIQTCG